MNYKNNNVAGKRQPEWGQMQAEYSIEIIKVVRCNNAVHTQLRTKTDKCEATIVEFWAGDSQSHTWLGVCDSDRPVIALQTTANRLLLSSGNCILFFIYS